MLKTEKRLAAPRTIDEYIARYPRDVQAILQKIRNTIRKVAPEAQEKVSYQMPAFALNGMLIYFAAFKEHIGMYPPVKGDAQFQKDTKAYRGPKGNFKFRLREAIPYGLIERLIRFRLIEHFERKKRATHPAPKSR